MTALKKKAGSKGHGKSTPRSGGHEAGETGWMGIVKWYGSAAVLPLEARVPVGGGGGGGGGGVGCGGGGGGPGQTLRAGGGGHEIGVVAKQN